ncbi:hypothetical protein [Staphylococcus cohnii]
MPVPPAVPRVHLAHPSFWFLSKTWISYPSFVSFYFNTMSLSSLSFASVGNFSVLPF